MKQITLEELLEAGCHFGHQVTRQNPKARDFVFEARDNIHIIDLAKTKEGLESAAAFIKQMASKPNSKLVIVGTKRQAKAIVEEKVQNAQDVFYVTNRWIGGTLTNYGEVVKNYKKLKDLSLKLASDEEKALYTKKEVGLWDKKRQKLESFYGGIKDMQKLPDALFVVDTHSEYLAVGEARSMGIPVVGIVDTNADPSIIDYPIPANDDAVGSLELLISFILDAWAEGKKEGVQEAEKKNKEEMKAAGEVKEQGEVAKTEKKEPKAKKTPVTKSKKEKVTTKSSK